MTSALVSLFAGTLSLELALLFGGRVRAPIGYMGSKRVLAHRILHATGRRPSTPVGALVAVDAGPWGEAWRTILDPVLGDQVVQLLDSWAGWHPMRLWDELRDAGRPDEPVARVASWLWLQGRSASCVPVWWEDDGVVEAAPPSPAPDTSDVSGHVLVMPASGSRANANRVMAHQMSKGAGSGVLVAPDPTRRGTWKLKLAPQRSGRGNSPSGGSGLTTTATVAGRIRGLRAQRWPSVVRILDAHPSPADVADMLGRQDLRGVWVYADPPYVGCTRYAAECPRDQVVALASAFDEAGAEVTVSEAQPLAELDGWHARQLTPKEALTANRPLAPSPQLAMWTGRDECTSDSRRTTF
jgi:hypothetical protein